MDMKMKAEEITTAGVSWDCKVTNGLVPIIIDEEADLQCATQAAFLIQGTVPQLKDAGVPWTAYLSNKMTFGEIDFYIRESLREVGKETYYPQYDIVNDKLTMNIGKAVQENN